MALSERKITGEAISIHGVVSAPDRMTGTAAENKKVFDRLVREVVSQQINGLIDELTSVEKGDSGAGDIGVTGIAGVNGTNVQAVLEELKRLFDELERVETELVDRSETAAESADAAAETAAEAASEAGKSETKAAQWANAAGQKANEAAQAATEAVESEEEAKAQAEAAQQWAKDAAAAKYAISAMKTLASTLAAGANATVNAELVEGGFVLSFGIPKGDKGDKGERGDSGVTSPVSGFFTLTVDGNGDLWVLAETEEIPDFEYDEETGGLYIVQEEA